jgi:hypothetical protein
MNGFTISTLLSKPANPVFAGPAGSSAVPSHHGTAETVAAGQRSPFATGEQFDLCTIMTLLLLLLYTSEARHIAIPVTALAVLAFINPALRQDRRFWLATTLVVLIGNYQARLSADNHKFLLAYWCLAILCSVHTARPHRSLAVGARWLVGMSFLFAVSWKLTSADYLNGTFFSYSLLLDDRFRIVAQALGGISTQVTDLNSAAHHALVNYDSKLDYVWLQSSPQVGSVAGFITWWTLGLEAAVATAFLAPMRSRLHRIRDIVLLLFVITTYAIAPVTGFGWILTVMGMAQSDHRISFVRPAYLGVFVLLQVYRFPWKEAFGAIAT